MDTKEFKKGDTISAYYRDGNVFNRNYKNEYIGFYMHTFMINHRRRGYIELICKENNKFKAFRVNHKRTICTSRMVLFEKQLW